jgi:site-specific DNA-methyltransferase (adenine-specific)
LDNVDLIITSPPYNLEKEYGTYEDNLTYEKYLDWVHDWLNQAYAALKTGGRICINVPMEIQLNGKQFIMNDYINILEELGYIRNQLIVWNKTNINTRTAWGSWKSPSCPNVLQPFEVILVYSKGTKKKVGDKNKIDITRDEFIQYTLGVWDMLPEKAKKIGHPAPFPKDLPYRCMKLFSYQDDLIVDPFMGSGTTAVVAKELNRKYIGFEINKDYIHIAEERLHTLV